MPDTASTSTPGNPFTLIADLLFQVRHSLEDPGDMGRPPRWIRIARARNATGSSDVIAGGVRTAIDGFAAALSSMVEITLRLQELLFQMDSAKALEEVTEDFIRKATSEAFFQGVQTVLHLPVPGSNPLHGVGTVLEQVHQFLGYIPEPEDVQVLGHELYRLLCIEQEPLPRLPNGTVDESKLAPATTVHHVNVERSGKIRLLQWAFNQKLSVYGLLDKAHPEDTSFALLRFGARRLWRTDNARLPTHVLETWSPPSGPPEPIVDWFYDGRSEPTEANRTLDITETFGLLEKLGYSEPAAAQKTVFGPELARRLRRFQAINELPISGELDNATLNRLLNLDYSAKSTARARPFDASRLPADLDGMEEATAPRVTGGTLRVVNPGAETPEEEGLSFVMDYPRYPYYKAGTPLPPGGSAPVRPGGGWISDTGGDSIPGFVALHSRYPRTTVHRFDGDRLTEGEAASGGQYFYAARFTEPWRPGRSGPPQSSIYPAPPDWPEGKPPRGSVSRMYQWIPLNTLHRPVGWNLFITASVLRRSLYEERSRTAGGVPDRGTLAVELYGDDVFKGDLGTPRPRNRSAEPAELRNATRRAEPWPSPADTTAQLTDEQVTRGRNWVKQSVENVLVPPSAVAMLVILEGYYTAGWDIDAYFDDVQVTFTFRKQ